jgi:hypothetical protein
MRAWFKNMFKSRAQRDRERGYYSNLPPIAGTQDELNAAFHKKYGAATARMDGVRRTYESTRVAVVFQTPCKLSRWGRLKTFYRTSGIPNPKELLMLLWPSQWLSEKLWRRWDPEDRNTKKAPAPKAGIYSVEHGITRCADGRVVHGKIHVPGA